MAAGAINNKEEQTLAELEILYAILSDNKANKERKFRVIFEYAGRKYTTDATKSDNCPYWSETKCKFVISDSRRIKFLVQCKRFRWKEVGHGLLDFSNDSVCQGISYVILYRSNNSIKEDKPITNPEQDRQGISSKEDEPITNPDQNMELNSGKEDKQVTDPQQDRQGISSKEDEPITNPDQNMELNSGKEDKQVSDPEQNIQLDSAIEDKPVTDPEQNRQHNKVEEDEPITDPEQNRQQDSAKEDTQTPNLEPNRQYNIAKKDESKTDAEAEVKVGRLCVRFDIWDIEKRNQQTREINEYFNKHMQCP